MTHVHNETKGSSASIVYAIVLSISWLLVRGLIVKYKI